MRYMDFNHLENFWIIFVIQYGFLFTTLLLIFYVSLIKKLFKNYNTFQKAIIIGSFLLLSSTNNSLATNKSTYYISHNCSICF